MHLHHCGWRRIFHKTCRAGLSEIRHFGMWIISSWGRLSLAYTRETFTTLLLPKGMKSGHPSQNWGYYQKQMFYQELVSIHQGKLLITGPTSHFRASGFHHLNYLLLISSPSFSLKLQVFIPFLIRMYTPFCPAGFGIYISVDSHLYIINSSTTTTNLFDANLITPPARGGRYFSLLLYITYIQNLLLTWWLEALEFPLMVLRKCQGLNQGVQHISMCFSPLIHLLYPNISFYCK